MRPLTIDRLHVAPAALAQQIRPDLALHQDEQPRPHAIQYPPDDASEIDGEIEHGVGIPQVPLRQLLSRARRRRDEEAKPGIAGLQLVGQRPRCEHLADRDRVNPNRRLAIEVERNRERAETLAEAAGIFLPPQGLIEEPRRAGDECQREHSAVESEHQESNAPKTWARRASGCRRV